jgi:hypothetical protein
MPLVPPTITTLLFNNLGGIFAELTLLADSALATASVAATHQLSRAALPVSDYDHSGHPSSVSQNRCRVRSCDAASASRSRMR